MERPEPHQRILNNKTLNFKTKGNNRRLQVQIYPKSDNKPYRRKQAQPGLSWLAIHTTGSFRANTQ
jgi:hypothetical protein